MFLIEPADDFHLIASNQLHASDGQLSQYLVVGPEFVFTGQII